MENNQEKLTSIARSYSRKINPELYGGNKFEPEEFFASYSDTIEKDATEGDKHQLSQELYRMARADVEASVVKRIAELGGDKAKPEISPGKQVGMVTRAMKANPEKTAGEVAKEMGLLPETEKEELPF